MAEFEALAKVDDIPEGGMWPARKRTGEPICLFKVDGRIGAVLDRCTHAEFAMSDGALHGGCEIECVWHGARFDCHTGRVTKGPADEPLPVFDVKIEGDTVLVGRQRPLGAPR
ncbi:MAG TPA: Rieske 2Fe-2S domain-containing protein [Gemmatimonadaceae bacterium]|nr:Rieske 2Fe-2S domain-containing protein [Gemmatimonadaceae bacterium]